MFFQEDSIYEQLKCKLCNKTFQDPVIIPCGETVCQHCITDYIEENAESENRGLFKCCLCEEEHSIPPKGFLKPIVVHKILELKPKQVNKGSYIEEFRADINKCINEVNQIQASLDSKREIVKDYFEAKRQQINQATESKIKEINKRARELLARIDELEREHLENLKDDKPQKEIEED